MESLRRILQVPSRSPVRFRYPYQGFESPIQRADLHEERPHRVLGEPWPEEPTQVAGGRGRYSQEALQEPQSPSDEIDYQIERT